MLSRLAVHNVRRVLGVRAAFAVGGLMLAGAVAAVAAQQASKPAVTLYKSASCGCCSLWADHMTAAGFDVKTIVVEDLGTPKVAYGVPEALMTCHTALVGGYVVEGHVPADDVKRLLREKPQVAGIGVAGMPAGSPGMEVPSGHLEPYTVVAFERSGRQTPFARHP
jgi:hypothetical protein